MRSLLLLAVLPLAAAAQPFETLEVTAAGLLTATTGDFDELWEPGPGVVLRGATPFYRGHVFLGATGARHTAQDEALPDYWALHAFGGWAYAFRLPGGVEAAAGLHAGLYNWKFDSDQELSAQWEAELATGLDLWASAPVGRGWRLGGGLQTARIYTRERLDLRFVHVGIGRRFAVPPWLRAVLR
ncbi:MAG: hypothetical protein R3362_04965 [Rhodothermales bacterium]|nr:hypothetical protein [Rhodothermales bacterium]